MNLDDVSNLKKTRRIQLKRLIDGVFDGNQKDFAEYVGIHPGNISRYLSGSRMLQDKAINKISKELDVGHSYFDNLSVKISKDEDLNDKDQRKNVLQKAQDIIYGDREKTYGHPAKNLECIAKFWNVYLSERFGPYQEEINLNADDVCKLMALLKLARLLNDPAHKDSLVDMAGYIGLAGRIQE